MRHDRRRPPRTERHRRCPRLASGQSFEQRIALGPTLGQCCGGALTLGFSRLDADALAAGPTPPLFTLQLYGAGHVGRAIARLLATLDCRVDWVDERENEFPALDGAPARTSSACASSRSRPKCRRPRRARTTSCSRTATTWTCDLRGDPEARRLRLVRPHRLEDQARALRAPLRERGIADERIARMTCPIGIPESTARSPK